MKLLFTYLLMLLFSFQALPVRELGKWLVKKAVTEQVQDLDEDSGAACKQKAQEETKIYLTASLFRLSRILSNRQTQISLHRSCLIPPHFVPEITTPPPNRC